MARYIDKDQVIEWIKQRLLPIVTNGNYDDWEKGADNERINFLSFINSLPEETNIKLLHVPNEISMSDKIQLIKQEIERRMNNLWYLIPEDEKVLKDDFTKDDANNLGKYTALESIFNFIDSLPKEPASEDLDRLVISLEETIGTSPHSREVIKEHLQRAAEWGRNHFEDKSEISSEDLEEEITKCYKSRIDLMMTRNQFRELIHHFIKLQKKQIIKDAMSGEYWDGSIYLDNRPTEYKDGDKVKIIIVKENG